MAELIAMSFPDDAEGQAMLKKVKKGLDRITRTSPKDEGGFYSYFNRPMALNRERDGLKHDYQIIWIECMISYDDNESGASIHVPTRDIKIGPFFLARRFTHFDMEKIVLHEYLHAALEQSDTVRGLEYGQREQIMHSQMEQIITFNLGYHGAWNPGCA